jgi:hypothetical protein
MRTRSAFLEAEKNEPAGFTYASAGVSIDAGNELVNRIKPIVKATKRIGSDSVIGGFGGLFDINAAGFKDPIIVSGTDGVGTKLKVAQNYGKHDTIGELRTREGQSSAATCFLTRIGYPLANRYRPRRHVGQRFDRARR